jgi:pimeloyl-ACP methyl ester carboxylesterase
MWDLIKPQLVKNKRVICIDLLGHGKSGNLGYIHSMEKQAEMVKYVLDKLKLKRYIIVGHSMGGYVALAFAELYPKNVKALCLMNSTAMADDKEKIKNRNRGIEAVKMNSKIFIRLAIPNLFLEKNRSVFQSDIRNIIQEALQMSKQGIIAAIEGMKIRNDRTILLKTSDFPILMIISKQDPALNFKSLIDQTNNTKVYTVIFNDGHMSHIENTKELISTLKNFVLAV